MDYPSFPHFEIIKVFSKDYFDIFETAEKRLNEIAKKYPSTRVVAQSISPSSDSLVITIVREANSGE